MLIICFACLSDLTVLVSLLTRQAKLWKCVGSEEKKLHGHFALEMVIWIFCILHSRLY